MSLAFLHLLLLIIVANGTPILLRNIVGSAATYPVDFGLRFIDNKRLFGDAKTWRGIILSIITTSIVAILLSYEWNTGAMVAAYAMLGDLLSSFIKRRMGLPSSSRAILIDQIPESLLPCLFLTKTFNLDIFGIVLLVGCFIILEILLSRILFWIGIRRRPY